MKQRNLVALLHLIEVPGLGPARIRFLVRAFGNPADVFEASLRDLCRVDGIDLKVARNIARYESTSFAENQLAKAGKFGVRIISLWDAEYPVLLKKIYDPPVLLFVQGRFGDPDEDSVAIVGARMTTPYGRKVAKDLSEHLAAAGLTIVSGFARGIDTVAHQAAVSVSGRTIAVLGNGLDVTYPPENRKLLPMIKDKGCFVSEFPLGTKPEAGNFPRRNRIISGLSHGTIVVEAGTRSGALLTALNAVDQNREVFAVPGRLTDQKSVGCLRLIRHGAIPVENPEQILDILNPKLTYPAKPVQKELKLDLTKEETIVYSKLSDEPKHVDEIVEETKLNPSSVLTLLLSLELKGGVTQLSGKHFVKT